ncbi:MAG: oxygenase [Paucimonas sp.]|jgi:ubiquinone biosynthesis UbiH/UbiF/VisC/COQ6 family hydroxylase|nr:oxygenase [Paucimonas sp.]
MRRQSDICIIGGGAVGKTAALCLAHAGLRVMLLQDGAVPFSKEGDSWDVRVYALNHTARDVLTTARVWSALDASRVAAVDKMDVRGDGGGRIAFDAYAARTSALAWIVEDWNLNTALDSALKFAPNIELVQGRAEGFLNCDSQVTVTMDNGDELSASLLIGADGAHSWVRGKCDIGVGYRSYGQRAIVTNFECEKPHHGVAYQWFASHEGIVALLPLPDRRVSLVWSAPVALADQLERLPLADLAERVSVFCSAELGRLSPLQPEVAKSFPLTLIRPQAITAPRVALIGDAAHVVHPLAGHGMNLGFADIADLVHAVSEREPHRDCGDTRILSRYARSRKEDILLMQAATDGLQRMFEPEFEPLRVLRNAGLNLFNHLPFVKRRLMEHAVGKRV